MIALCPLIWNILARLEYKTNILSTIFFSKYIGCFALAVWIFGFSIYRDALVMDVMRICPKAVWLDEWRWQAFGMVLGIVGGVMVGSAYLRLGITGTYLGDYFGILMEKRETRFPFSVFDNPMYDGSTLLFLSKAIS